MVVMFLLTTRIATQSIFWYSFSDKTEVLSLCVYITNTFISYWWDAEMKCVN